MHIPMKPMIAAIFAATLAGTAAAQLPSNPSAAPANPSAPTAQSAADVAAAKVSDAQLKNFASAQEEIDEIRSKYVEKVTTEQDPQKRAETENEMQEEMVEAVEENELDVPTYNRIAQLLPLSSDLQKRLQQHE